MAVLLIVENADGPCPFLTAQEICMPELPEVETVVKTLAPEIVGRRIESLVCLNERSWQDTLSCSLLEQHTPLITGAGRRGKLLLIRFDPFCLRDRTVFALAFHLKMTGRLFFYENKKQPEKHTRLILFLDRGTVFFDDARKFGYGRFVTDKSAEDWEFWRTLAKAPLEMTGSEFVQAFRNRQACIKSLLLNQTVVSGVGNIYADEALFAAKIPPHEKASLLSDGKLLCLHRCLKDVLEESIAFCGSSIKDYRTAKGDVGSFQNKFKVYGREGQKCFVCGGGLDKIKISGRTTVFCPNCQKQA